MPTYSIAEYAERFWSFLDRSDPTACWLWTGRRNEKGYGEIKFRTRYRMAHRMAWELTHGPIAPGLDLCHRCDNPPCCNPAHLFPGTRGQNARDKIAKGRHVYTDGGRGGFPSRVRYHGLDGGEGPSSFIAREQCERFLSRLAIRADEDCWFWTGKTNTRGYGEFSLNGKSVRAHRVAYRWQYGPIPDGHYCCHYCDTPACCNPLHLYAATQKTNMRDCSTKGRIVSRRGSKHGGSRLTEEQVQEVRRLRREGLTQGRIAEIVGMSKQMISCICTGQFWAWLEDITGGGAPLPQEAVSTRGSNHPKSKLNEDQVREVRRLIRAGERNTDIGERYGVHGTTIHAIRIGRSWHWLPDEP